jgi:hypothetical protein
MRSLSPLVLEVKPTLESRGSLDDLYKTMHKLRQKNPADIFSYMSMWVIYFFHIENRG